MRAHFINVLHFTRFPVHVEVGAHLLKNYTGFLLSIWSGLSWQCFLIGKEIDGLFCLSEMLAVMKRSYLSKEPPVSPHFTILHHFSPHSPLFTTFHHNKQLTKAQLLTCSRTVQHTPLYIFISVSFELSLYSYTLRRNWLTGPYM